MPNLYEEIENFYEKIAFPLHYEIEDLDYYRDNINNLYLKKIDQYLSPNNSILDVGAGTGLITNLFAIRYPTSNFTAIDISGSIYYGKKFSKNEKISNTRWIKKNFIQYQTEKKFDSIICQGVLHHIPDWRLAVEKIKEFSKPQGIVLLGVYHPVGKFLQKIFKSDRISETMRKDQFENPFELSFTKRQVTEMMKPFQLQEKVPDGFLKALNIGQSIINSGGLTLYVFKNT